MWGDVFVTKAVNKVELQFYQNLQSLSSLFLFLPTSSLAQLTHFEGTHYFI